VSTLDDNSGMQEPLTQAPFDFEAHGHGAALEFQRVRARYEDFASVCRDLVKQCLTAAGVEIHSVDGRAKSVKSLARKAATPLESEPERPKYGRPLEEITDLAAIRVITFFPRVVQEVEEIVAREFEVVERSDKAAKLREQERFGYQSVHYLVRLASKRRELPEYSRFADLILEIQVRTILQHAWAEIEHDIQYKSVATIPQSIRRRFMSLAGMLEIADREFQSVQDEDERLREEARQSVREGRLKDVEITPDALKAYLNARFGPDGRMSDFSYSYAADALRHLGYANFQQVEECIRAYDPDTISRLYWGTRQGQINRFEETLLAGMGEAYVMRHQLGPETWFLRASAAKLKAYDQGGIKLGAYRPSPDVLNGRQVVLREALRVIEGAPSADTSAVERVLSALSPREAKVIRLLYGFEGGRPHTLDEVASMFGVAPWTVTQLLYQGMQRLDNIDASIALDLPQVIGGPSTRLA
jgi:putative GTP pyrophosphokinase